MNRGKKKNIIQKTMPYFGKDMPWFCFCLVLAFVFTVAALLIPQITQLIIDRILNPALGGEAVYSDSNVLSFLIDGLAADDYMGMLYILIACLFVVNLIKYACHYSRWNLAHKSMINGENKVRNFAFGKMLRQSPLVLNRYTGGDLLNVTNNDPTAIKDLYLHFVPVMITGLFSIVIALFFLVRISPFLTLIPLATGCLTAITVHSYNKILRRKFDNIRKGNVELNTFVQENINGVRVVRAFSTEDDELKRFKKYNSAFRDNYVDLARTTSKYSMIFTIFGESVGIFSLILGIVFAVRGVISVGEFVTFTSYCFTINNCIVMMAGQIGNIQNGVVCANRLFEFADRPEAVTDPPIPLPVPEKPEIRFRNVSVKFDDGGYALRNIDLTIPYGTRIGIMGRTGAGKSVLIKLLTRLYDCTEGEILLDGINIKNFAINDLRRVYSPVLQDVFLFSDTVEGNIAFYDSEASREKVIACARAACVEDFIPKLTDGYDTVVGERGLGLSGGQKQRVSIARALLKDAPVILLDDCTSALDYETEKQISENLYRAYGDKTTITCSHRAGSVAFCDEIIYLEDGKIVERGTHEELMALKGRYWSIYTEQESLREEELG